MGEPDKVYSHDDRLALGQTVLCLLDDWGLNAEQQAAMLGLDVSDPVTVDVIGAGSPLPESGDVIERARHFLNISLTLNALHNYEAEWLKGWMVQGNEVLGGQTPFDFIHEYGTTGLAWLEDHLGQKLAEQNVPEFALDSAV